MSFPEKLRNAFENVAPHITNLDAFSSIIQQLTNDVDSLRACLIILERSMSDMDVTLRTDIQILINEILHV
jgi:hypothetical protein